MVARRHRNPQARTPVPRRGSNMRLSIARLLPGRPFNGVLMTFIMEEFSGGPWTKAVQGAKKLKYFLRQAMY